MSNPLLDIASANNIEDIELCCREFSLAHGFEHFIYADLIPTSFFEPSIVIANGYPEAWRNHYAERNYIASDPVVLHCVSRSDPLVWEDIWKSIDEGSKEYEFMSEACEYGLCSGVSFSIHSPKTTFGIFSLASALSFEATREKIELVLPRGQAFGTQIHNAISNIPQSDSDFENIKQVHLTEREQQCLAFAAEGETSSTMASRLNVSESTIIFHLQNATKKLGATNRIQAVAQAITKGILKPRL